MGLSEFTNEAGARAVAAAFPEFPCTPVKVRPCVDPDDCLNLDMIQVRGELLACNLLLFPPHAAPVGLSTGLEMCVPTNHFGVLSSCYRPLSHSTEVAGSPKKFLKKLMLKIQSGSIIVDFCSVAAYSLEVTLQLSSQQSRYSVKPVVKPQM